MEKLKNHKKWKNSTPVCLFSVKIGMEEVHRNTNKTYFLDFWFFAILGFYSRFWAKMAILAIFRPSMAHICPKKQKIKNPKNKFCLYSYELPSCQFLRKIEKLVLSFFIFCDFFIFSHRNPYICVKIARFWRNSNFCKISATSSWEVVEPILDSGEKGLSSERRRGKSET